MASAEQPSSSSDPPLSEIEKLKKRIDDLDQEKVELKESKRRLQAIGGNKKTIEKIEEECREIRRAITVQAALLTELLKQQNAQQDNNPTKKSRFHVAQRVHKYFSRSHDSSVQLHLPESCLLCGVSGNASNCLNKSHILQLKDLDVNDEESFNELYELLENWEDVRIWRRAFVVSHPMNMIWLCKLHHTDFDQYKFSLIVNPLEHKISFMSLCPEYEDKVRDANIRIQGLDLSHLSNRAISMRMEKAMKSGNAFQGKIGVDYVSWQGLRDFSMDGSEHSKDSEDAEEGTSEVYDKAE